MQHPYYTPTGGQGPPDSTTYGSFMGPAQYSGPHGSSDGQYPGYGIRGFGQPPRPQQHRNQTYAQPYANNFGAPTPIPIRSMGRPLQTTPAGSFGGAAAFDYRESYAPYVHAHSPQVTQQAHSPFCPQSMRGPQHQQVAAVPHPGTSAGTADRLRHTYFGATAGGQQQTAAGVGRRTVPGGPTDQAMTPLQSRIAGIRQALEHGLPSEGAVGFVCGQLFQLEQQVTDLEREGAGRRSTTSSDAGSSWSVDSKGDLRVNDARRERTAGGERPVGQPSQFPPYQPPVNGSRPSRPSR